MKQIIFAILFSVISTAAFAQVASDVIGTVMEVEGNATLKPQSGATASLAVNTPVRLNDQISTGAASRVMIVFIDDTEMTLSENTDLTIDEYIYDADDTTDNKGVYSVIKGSFLYVSGLIAKKINPDVTVNTPAGAIGIRGTTFWGGDVDGEYGVMVNDGEVNVKNDGGEVSVKKGLGTFVKDRRAAPGAARAWAKDRVDRAVKTIQLKDPARVRNRIRQAEPQRREMRKAYKQQAGVRRQMLRQKMQQNQNPGQQQLKEKLQNLTPEQQQRLQQYQQQQPQEKLQQLQQLRDKQQQGQKLQQNLQQRPQLQQKIQQKRGDIQQKIQQRQ